MPLLEAARKDPLQPRVICSLRDILVEKTDRKKYEERVLDVLNVYYDALLVHADPRVVDLAETFSRTGAVTIPIMYTGFVCRPAPSPRKHDGRQVIVASTGGGRVGTDLLQTTVRAFRSMPGEKLELRVFLGPFMEDTDRTALMASTCGDTRIALREFSNDFPGELAAADLSISMAGYNTCMDILASRVPALVYPFPQNREQAMRASRLESLGLLRTLTDLSETSLAQAMETLLLHPLIPAPNRIDLNGAEKTARILAALWP
jgi:predicted glycosyltransferase